MVLPKPTVISHKETARSVMERGMAVHTGMKPNECTTIIVVESDSDRTDYELQPESKYLFKQPFNAISKTDTALADLDVVTKTMLGPLLNIA